MTTQTASHDRVPGELGDADIDTHLDKWNRNHCAVIAGTAPWILALALAGILLSASAFGQGECAKGYGTPACPLSAEVATAPIKPVFAPTGWKTVALDHITFEVPDYRKEAAFYIALMGWKLRSDEGKQAVLDIGHWGSAIFKQAPELQAARVKSFCFVIKPWDAKKVESELRKRGLSPVAENDGKGFESFHVKDPDGWDLQISNGNGLMKARQSPSTAQLSAPAPFASTAWKTVWLDHLSFYVANYKKSASFYSNLLGWKDTYDEGSQNELLIGEVGDIIIRGGNPNNPKTAPARNELDHISFGISPWDTDAVRAALEQRGLRARVDTSDDDDIHVAAYKSYHTTTPNGYDLQISFVTHENRLPLSNAVKPKTPSGP
jgi:catechol 2,3-dioxygenase-like lactoylglutathione lyase family enzyme